MSPAGRSRKGARTAGRTALAGIASFFRQLSLFDPAPVEPPPPRPAVPKVPVQVPIAPRDKAVGPAVPAAPAGFSASPSLIPPPTFPELCRGRYGHIEVVLKKRLWESWRVAWTRRNEALRLEVPAILEDAPRPIKEAVLEWSVLATRRSGKRDPALRNRRSELEAAIRAYLHAPAEEAISDADAGTPDPGNPPVRARPKGALAKRLARNRRKIERLEPKGGHHDLDASFAAVNARYFAGSLQAKLTWSARLGGLSTHSVAHDGDGNPYHLISISRGYDNAEVTPEILGGVVYHECLHIAIPPRRERGRRVVHGADFRRREREYDHFEVWRRWHRDGLPKALRRMRSATRRH